jgi:dephospho-CoA kinase
MLKVGITGGIGSGKTTVCKIFETLGIPVYYADDRAKWLMENDEQLVKGIKDLFGEEAYTPEGKLNRPYIAQIVFSEKDKLSSLNQLVHPAVGLDGIRWNEAQTGVPYTLKEAALIYESGSYQLLDKVITVFAPKDLRIERVMARDQVDREAVESRIAKQMSEEEKMERADYVIYNDGNQSLIKQVYTIHKDLTSLKKDGMA